MAKGGGIGSRVQVAGRPRAACWPRRRPRGWPAKLGRRGEVKGGVVVVILVVEKVGEDGGGGF